MLEQKEQKKHRDFNWSFLNIFPLLFFIQVKFKEIYCNAWQYITSAEEGSTINYKVQKQRKKLVSQSAIKGTFPLAKQSVVVSFSWWAFLTSYGELNGGQLAWVGFFQPFLLAGSEQAGFFA